MVKANIGDLFLYKKNNAVYILEITGINNKKGTYSYKHIWTNTKYSISEQNYNVGINFMHKHCTEITNLELIKKLYG